MNEIPTSRRQFLKFGSAALAMISVMVVPGRADAVTNPPVRNLLEYQANPDGEKNCGNCIQFVPGSSAKAIGSCKVITGDTEISPQGYCTAWTKIG